MLLAVLYDFPKFVRDNVSTLVQLILGFVILPKVRVFVREIVEIQNEFLKDFLFVIETVQKFKEAFLNIGVFDLYLLSVETHIPEDSSHLVLVVLAHVLPDAENDRLEDSLNVITTRRHGSNSGCSTDN